MGAPHEGQLTLIPARRGGAVNRFPHWQATLMDMAIPRTLLGGIGVLSGILTFAAGASIKRKSRHKPDAQVLMLRFLA
jgi:hypothetical protein